MVAFNYGLFIFYSMLKTISYQQYSASCFQFVVTGVSTHARVAVRAAPAPSARWWTTRPSAPVRPGLPATLGSSAGPWNAWKTTIARPGRLASRTLASTSASWTGCAGSTPSAPPSTTPRSAHASPGSPATPPSDATRSSSAPPRTTAQTTSFAPSASAAVSLKTSST